MGKILVIYGSDFSRNRIDKVDIINKVETTVDNQSLSSSTVSINNPSLKNNNQQQWL